MGFNNRTEQASIERSDPLCSLVDPRVTLRFEQPGVVKSAFADIQYYLAKHDKPLIAPALVNLFGFEDLDWHRQRLKGINQTVMYLGYNPPAILSDEINLVQTASATIVIDEGAEKSGSNGRMTPKKLSLAAVAQTDSVRADLAETGITHTPDAKRVIAARFSLSGRGNLESLLLSLSFPEEKYVESIGNDTKNEKFAELLSRIPTRRHEPRSHPGFITSMQREITDDTGGIIIQRGWNGFHFGDVSELEVDSFNQVQVFAENLGFSLALKKNLLNLTFTPPDATPSFPSVITRPQTHIFPKPPGWTISLPTFLAEPQPTS